jgi:hypothetical protein
MLQVLAEAAVAWARETSACLQAWDRAARLRASADNLHVSAVG